jgi:hypothetical protein
MGFHEVPWNSMRFYDVLVNRSVPTEANRGLTSYNCTPVILLALLKVQDSTLLFLLLSNFES